MTIEPVTGSARAIGALFNGLANLVKAFRTGSEHRVELTHMPGTGEMCPRCGHIKLKMLPPPLRWRSGFEERFCITVVVLGAQRIRVTGIGLSSVGPLTRRLRRRSSTETYIQKTPHTVENESTVWWTVPADPQAFMQRGRKLYAWVEQGNKRFYSDPLILPSLTDSWLIKKQQSAMGCRTCDPVRVQNPCRINPDHLTIAERLRAIHHPQQTDRAPTNT